MRRNEIQLKQNREWYYRNRESQLAKMKVYRDAVKDEVFAAYGGYKCVCCGESNKRFLTIDHINNDGHIHRKEINSRGGVGIYNWLKREGFPPGFQVLCYNCNMGKARNKGICPHKD